MKTPLTIFFIFLSTVFSQETTIAILPFDAAGISNEEATILTDRLSTEFYKIGSFVVIERSKMDEVLKEQGFQQTGCTTSECAVEVGNLLGVQKMVTGTIGRLGSLYTISARLVDVESGKIERQVSKDVSGSIETLLVETMAEVAAELSGVSYSKKPAAPITGEVQFNSAPVGVKIIVNGNTIGNTPFTKNSEVGKYYFTALKENYESYEGEFEVKPNDTTDVSFKLNPKITSLTVFGESGIEVFLDGKSMGIIENDSLVIDSLMFGSYSLSGKKTGYEDKIIIVSIMNTLIDYRKEIVLEKIKVRVVFGNGRQNQFLTLSIIDDSTGELKTYKSTTISGSFSIDLYENKYTIKITHFGFEDIVDELDVKINQSKTMFYSIPDPEPIKVPITFNLKPKYADLSIIKTKNLVTPWPHSNLTFDYNKPQLMIYGTYDLIAVAPKYHSKNISVLINKPDPKTIQVALEPKKRFKALTYSSFLPGTGQFYAENKTKSAIFSLASAGLAALLYNSYSAYTDEEPLVSQYKRDYQIAADPNEISLKWNTYQSQVNTVNDLQTQLMIYGGALAVTWVANLIDVYLFSGLLE